MLYVCFKGTVVPFYYILFISYFVRTINRTQIVGRQRSGLPCLGRVLQWRGFSHWSWRWEWNTLDGSDVANKRTRFRNRNSCEAERHEQKIKALHLELCTANLGCPNCRAKIIKNQGQDCTTSRLHRFLFFFSQIRCMALGVGPLEISLDSSSFALLV